MSLRTNSSRSSGSAAPAQPGTPMPPAAVAVTPRRTRPRAAVRRIAFARAVSFTGGAAAFMALNFEVYRITRSAAWLAATLFLTFGVVGLAGPLAGLIGDRFDRRRVMIASDLAAAAAFVAMAFVHAPATLLAIAFVAAVLETPFRAASSAAIPSLIGEEASLGWANGLISMGANAGILVGPVVGGVLVGLFGAQAVFAANAVSFVGSAALVATVRGSFRSDPATGAGERQRLSAGFRVMFGDRVLRTIALAWAAIVAGGAICMVADVPLATLFNAGSAGYGAMIACWGAGSILGSLAGRWVTMRREPLALLAGAALCAIGTVAVAVSPVFWPVNVAILVAGFGDAIMSVADQSMFQRRTRDAVRARVMAAQDSLIQITMALAFGVAGLVIGLVGARGAYVVGGATAFVAVGMLVPIRRWTLGRHASGAGGARVEGADGESPEAASM
jgi:MFS family permease